MTERYNFERQKLIEEYEIIFKELPRLRELALGYWEQTSALEPGYLGMVEEDYIFTTTILDMSNILLDNPNFRIAMKKTEGDVIENAIIESILMVDIVLDTKDDTNNEIQ